MVWKKTNVRRMAVLSVFATVLWPVGAASAAEVPQATEILDATGVKGGLIVHVGCGDGKLTAALCANSRYLVHGLDGDAANVAEARKHIQSLGRYGQISVEQWEGKRLPYVDNLVNLVVSDQTLRVPMDEILRVLVPNGVAYLRQDGRWNRTVKPRPKEIDEWTHYLHDATNNPVAHDAVVGPPRRLQWVGSPRWTRHHDHMSSISAVVSTAGRLFYILDEGSTASIQLPSKWSIIARDAFNGTILWKRPIPTWHTRIWPLKSGPAYLPRRLVAVGERVYVTLGLPAPLTALDAATGETIRTYEGSTATDEVIASDGVLFLLVDERPDEAKRKAATVDDIKRRGRAATWKEVTRKVMAVQADSGQVLWEKTARVLPLTLTVDARRVFFHDGEKVVCLDRKSGNQVWASKPIARWKPIRSYFAPTLTVQKDVVLFAGGEKMIHDVGGTDTMTALSAKDGKVLWTAEHPPSGYRSPEDVLVVGGLVWTGGTTRGSLTGVFTGRDLETGEIKHQFPPDVKTYWFHHRCHRGKATDRYLLVSRTGIEFIDHESRHWIPHHWVRGACLYGVMPCNGLLYAPPHPCACYLEAKLNGFNALAPAQPSKARMQTSDDVRLVRGPAYAEEIRTAPAAKARSDEARDADWPTYRHDPERSGLAGTPVPTDVSPAWQADVGGRLSSVVVAGGKVFVASVDTHTVHALDAVSGKALWRYTTGGRVDSPPTIYEGRALFGSADGWVYCLRASDGALVWRFRAAPRDARLMAAEQLASVWPVHGNVLIQDGAVWCVAGRSMFLDGGLRLLSLDPKTGRRLSETVLDDRDPQTGENLQTRVMGLNMPVALPDVLSSDGRYLYMRSQMFDLKGKRLQLGPHSSNPTKQGAAQQGEGAHLFCPTGFLDDTWFHRTYWVYGRSFSSGWNGYFEAGKFAPAGRILAFDASRVYGFGRKPRYYRWTTPLEHQLFATDKDAPKVAGPIGNGKGPLIRVAKSKSLNPAGKPLAVEAWVKAEKPDGVVVARGGPMHGYALIVRGGKPRFAVRVKEEAFSVEATQKVVGKWVHLAGVLTEGKGLQIYVDGELSGSAKVPGFIAADPHQAMEIGADEEGSVGNYPSPSGFAGIIDEVRIYHGTLTAAEIRQHSAAPGAPKAGNATLVLRYAFDKGDAADGSGNKNHGKVDGAKSVPGKLGKGMKFTGRRKHMGQHMVKYHWTREIPLLVRAMVLADGRLFIAGPPDVVDEEASRRQFSEAESQAKLAEQAAALDGRKGALLWAVSTSDGRRLAERRLASPPVWDGMAAAHERLYIALRNGQLVCMAK